MGISVIEFCVFCSVVGEEGFKCKDDHDFKVTMKMD